MYNSLSLVYVLLTSIQHHQVLNLFLFVCFSCLKIIVFTVILNLYELVQIMSQTFLKFVDTTKPYVYICTATLEYIIIETMRNNQKS